MNVTEQMVLAACGTDRECWKCGGGPPCEHCRAYMRAGLERALDHGLNEDLKPRDRQWEHEAISSWFSLSYANYLVLPRSLLQSMTDVWQERFVTCLDELHRAFAHVPQAPAYDVRVLKRPCVLVTPIVECDECHGTGVADGQIDDECEFCDGTGDVEEEMRYETPEEVGIMSDPVPHYNRTRTRIKRQDELND